MNQNDLKKLIILTINLLNLWFNLKSSQTIKELCNLFEPFNKLKNHAPFIAFENIDTWCSHNF